MLTQEIKKFIDKSILCWLATSSSDNFPNVSPKEIFTYYGNTNIIIANVASPQTVRNIKENNKVCISFIDILVQKGFQLKGTAEIVKKSDSNFKEMEELLFKFTEGKFPFSTITNIAIEKMKRIIAPRYILFPETTEEEQIQGAIKSYNIKPK